MNLPTFLWLWRIAAWSMGLSLLAYVLLGITGFWMFYTRTSHQDKPNWLRILHLIIGSSMISLVLLLLLIGIIGTIGHFGSLGHSPHLVAGLTTVTLVVLSGASAMQISPQQTWARPTHISINIALFFSFVWVSLSGWSIVQKYLP
jgi:hypothetical protein